MANIPLAIIFGFVTIASLLITAVFGVLTHIFRKNVFRYHLFFASLTVILALTHFVLAYLLWFKGITI